MTDDNRLNTAALRMAIEAADRAAARGAPGQELAFDAGLTRAVLRVFLRTVFSWQRRRATRRGLVEARSGSVTAIQRFGGALNAASVPAA